MTTFQDISFGTLILNGNDASDYLIGEIIMWPNGQQVPDNFLSCDGRSLSQTTYSDLYSVIGTKYGGDATNFNLPNLNSSSVSEANYTYLRGISNMSGETTINSFTYTDNTFGNNQISINQVPSHKHNITNNLNSIRCDIDASTINSNTRNHFGTTANVDLKRANVTDTVPDNFKEYDGGGNENTSQLSHRHNILYNNNTTSKHAQTNAVLLNPVEVTYGVALNNNHNTQSHYVPTHSKVQYLICKSL